jgi:hypothetical protein
MIYAHIINNRVVKEIEINTEIPPQKRNFYLPVEENIPDYDVDTQEVVFTNYTIQSGKVIKNYAVVDFPAVTKKEIAYTKSIDAGYTIPNTNITLGINDYDRLQFSHLLILLNELLSMNQVSLDTVMKIQDKDGKEHSLTVSQIKQAIAGAGMHYYGIWQTKESK